VGLLGPNGAGKTTVFYMITGLIAADQGTISLDGTDITTLPMYQRAGSVSDICPRKARSFAVLRLRTTFAPCLSS
jgi:lipopolysaccharide export system ATP-binding protein